MNKVYKWYIAKIQYDLLPKGCSENYINIFYAHHLMKNMNDETPQLTKNNPFVNLFFK